MRHTPWSWLWLYSVQPLSKRVSSALPCDVIDSMTASRSDFSKHLSAGNANQADTRRSPTTALARRAAARRLSGPPGVGQDRKSFGAGQSASVGGDLGGCRIMKKKKK